MEHNQNALRVERDGEPASGSLAVTAAPPLAEYDTATGTFITRARAPRPVEPVPVRHRHDGWTPARQRQFLEELADCGIVEEAAGRVGMSRQSAWQLRRRAEGTAFAFAFETALEAGAGRLRSIAFERAVEGEARPVFYHGEKIGERRVYDNRLLLALVAKLPAGEAAARIPEVRNKWESWLDAIEQGRERPVPVLADAGTPGCPVWQDEDGTWLTEFPPADGFAGDEQGTYGEDDYMRTLTAEELAAVLGRHDAERARDEADRDAFFGPEK